MEQEIWRDIAGYDNMYQVSNLGRIKSLPRKMKASIGFASVRGRIMKPAIDSKGYLRCALSKDNVLRTFKVHRLVAAAFIPNPNNYPQINHINGDKRDNRVENLEWCNNSMNQIHAYRLGLNPPHRANEKKCVLIKGDEKWEFNSISEAANFLGYKQAACLRQSLGKQVGKAKGYTLVRVNQF